MGRRVRFALLLLILLTLSGCAALSGKQSSSDFKEQLYIDARLGFAIKHPLEWQQQDIPVSQPEYRSDTVTWVIKDLQQPSAVAGQFMIRSSSADAQKNLSDLLSEFLSSCRELKSKQLTTFEHPAGSALRMLGDDESRGRLTMALKGQRRDFIIAFDFPSDRFADLLPIFDEIVASFVEIIRADAQPN